MSQIGSGSLPVESPAERGVSRSGRWQKQRRGSALAQLEAAFRALPVPVLGSCATDAFQLDLRCLAEDEAAFVDAAARALPHDRSAPPATSTTARPRW